jgi:RimJ/RimL family protein N-acetyltransferase
LIPSSCVIWVSHRSRGRRCGRTSSATSSTGPNTASASGPLRRRKSGALIGRVGLAYHRVWPDDPEVGWLIDTRWQGQGLATEAGAACVGYGFKELNADRIGSICTAENAASRRVMEKLGFRLWRTIRDETLALDLLLHVRER